MNIPEEAQEIIIANFKDNRIPIPIILKIANRESKGEIKELKHLYDFLETYQNEKGIVLQRKPITVGPELQRVVLEKKSRGLNVHRIVEQVRLLGYSISEKTIAKIYEEAKKNNIEDQYLYNKRQFVPVKIYDATIDELKASDMDENDIYDYFIKLGIDIQEPTRFHKVAKSKFYNMPRQTLNKILHKFIFDGKSYREIYNIFKEYGIEIDVGDIRKYCHEINPTQDKKVKTKEKLDAYVSMYKQGRVEEER